jgi:hypothetical protein
VDESRGRAVGETNDLASGAPHQDIDSPESRLAGRMSPNEVITDGEGGIAVQLQLCRDGEGPRRGVMCKEAPERIVEGRHVTFLHFSTVERGVEAVAEVPVAEHLVDGLPAKEEREVGPVRRAGRQHGGDLSLASAQVHLHPPRSRPEVDVIEVELERRAGRIRRGDVVRVEQRVYANAARRKDADESRLRLDVADEALDEEREEEAAEWVALRDAQLDRERLRQLAVDADLSSPRSCEGTQCADDLGEDAVEGVEARDLRVHV